LSQIIKAKVISNAPVAAGCGLMRLEAPEVARTASPGQFVMVRVAPASLDPLLRRAFAVHYTLPEEGRFDILYGIVGKGTAIMAAARPGDILDVLGPLGRGFDLDPKACEAYLVAGGVGAAPLLFLAQEAVRRGAETRLFYGARTAQLLLRADAFRELGVEVTVATEDGSEGLKGFVTEPLLPALMGGGIGPPQARVYACGPMPMLSAVARLCRGVGVSCQVSLHSFMACGIGTCLACAIARKTEPGQAPSYAKVCTDGPVFDAEEVLSLG
jgi:dihydroorotate dehydrogenase electron transfer subunit